MSNQSHLQNSFGSDNLPLGTMLAEGGDAGDQKDEVTKKKTGLGVFASCCCCADDSSSETGGKEHEVVIPKPRGCTDCAYLIVYIIFCCILVSYRRYLVNCHLSLQLCIEYSRVRLFRFVVAFDSSFCSGLWQSIEAYQWDGQFWECLWNYQ